MKDKPIVGQGHPLDPDRKKILSPDDEKRIDEKGVPVVDGKLWSKSGTDLYIVVGLSNGPLVADRDIIGTAEISLDKFGYLLTLGVTRGKPTFSIDVIGACLELPDDLGADAKKRGYVTEWLVNTVIESLENRDILLSKDDTFTINLMECVAHGADIAITAAKL